LAVKIFPQNFKIPPFGRNSDNSIRREDSDAGEGENAMALGVARRAADDRSVMALEIVG